MRSLASLALVIACGGGGGAAAVDAPLADAAADAPVDADPGPQVDRGDPKLEAFDFSAADADPAATQALGRELGYLDTRVAPRGLLVVYLHGAIGVTATTTCGSRAQAEVLAAMGFHTLHPCYRADYGVGACGADIGGCRLEAFEGVDHTAVIDIAAPNAIEPRIVAALRHLATLHPGGDWGYYLDGDRPRWSKIIISGHSHGASSAALIGKVRPVARAVSLAGPLDTGQAWLAQTSITPVDRFYAFTHTADAQHPGHLESFTVLGLPGEPVSVDAAAPPFGGSHRLISSLATTDGHGAVQTGGSSPKAGDGSYRYLAAWRYLYGAD